MSSELRPVVAHADLVRLKGRARTVSPVLLVAPSGPRDVMAVRNELARIEARGGVALLDDAATLFGGTANWDSPAEFHARNASSKMRRVRDLEVEAYGHLAFAATMEQHLLIIGANPRTYLHFSQVAYIIEETDHGMACQFSIILNNKQDLTFICNSSYEYLQWINSLQTAYKQSHPFSNTMRAPFEYDFDDRRSIASDGRSIVSQHSYYDGKGERNTVSASSAYIPTIRARSTSRSRSRPRQLPLQEPVDNYQPFYGQFNTCVGYAPPQQGVTSRRSVPNMTARGMSPGRGYYQDNDVDYNESGGNKYDELLYRQQQSRLQLQQHQQQQQQQHERFRKSTRPTKLYADDEFSDTVSQTRMGAARSASIPRDMALPQKPAPLTTKAQPEELTSKKPSTKRNSLTAEEVYEMTVQAYKAGFADEVDDDRAQRNSKRFSAGAGGGRAGYPTRAGSQVRFTGEDEVAVDMRVLSSDGSSLASHGSSLQRQGDERRMVQQQEQRSLSVDPRFTNGRGGMMGSPQQRDAYGYPLNDPYNYSAARSRAMGSGSVGGGVSMYKRSNSVDINSTPHSLSVDSQRSENQEPTHSKLHPQQQQPFTKTVSSAISMNSRNVSKDSRKQVDSLFEDNRAKKERETSEKKAEASSSNEHAKKYLLAKLFGKGAATRNDAVRSDIINPPSGTATFSKAQLVANTRLNAANGGWQLPASLIVSPAPPGTPASIATVLPSTYSTVTTKNSLSNSVLDETVRSSPEPSSSLQGESLPQTAERQVKQVVTTVTASSSANSSRKSSPDRSGSSSNKANVSFSPYYEFMTNEMMATMQKIRGSVLTACGLTGTTASSLGFYDEEGLSPMIRSAIESQKECVPLTQDDEILDSDSSFGADGYASGGVNSAVVIAGWTPIARIQQSVAGITKNLAFSKSIIVQTTGLLVKSDGMQAKYSPVIPQAETPPPDPVQATDARDDSGDPRSKTTTTATVTKTTSTKAASPTLPATVTTGKESSSSAFTPVSHAETPITRSSTPTQSQPEAGVYSPRRTPARNSKMSANSAALRESLMATLQASTSFQNASVVKTDRERVIRAAQELARTLQKMDPVGRSPATRTVPVILPAANDGEPGIVRSAVVAFESPGGMNRIAGGSSSSGK